MRFRYLALVAVVVAAVGAACAPLPAWQRGRLVSEAMKDPGDPSADSFDTHWRTIKETAVGAGGTGAVSCGCN